MSYRFSSFFVLLYTRTPVWSNILVVLEGGEFSYFPLSFPRTRELDHCTLLSYLLFGHANQTYARMSNVIVMLVSMDIRRAGCTTACSNLLALDFHYHISRPKMFRWDSSTQKVPATINRHSSQASVEIRVHFNVRTHRLSAIISWFFWWWIGA